MSSNLSQEQKQRMEENRRRAMEIRAAKSQPQPSTSPACSSLKTVNQSPMPGNVSAYTMYNRPFLSKSLAKPLSGSNARKSSAGTMNSKSYQHGSKNSYQKQQSLAYNGSSSYKDPFSIRSGSLTLISKDRFELVMEYHEPTINAIKAISGREYGKTIAKTVSFKLIILIWTSYVALRIIYFFHLDVNKKRWNFPLSQYADVLAAIRKLQPPVAVGELPKLVIEVGYKCIFAFKKLELEHMAVKI